MISDATRRRVLEIALERLKAKEEPHHVIGFSEAFYQELDAQTSKIFKKTRRRMIH